MKTRVLLLTCSLAALAMPGWVGAETVFTSREGWTADGDLTTEAPAVELMRHAEEQETSGQLSAALADYKALVKRYPVSVLAGKAQKQIGKILEGAGEYDAAYDAFSTYLSKYPKGDDFESVVDSMFKIAKLFLEGEKKKVLGVKIASSMERARQMFEGIVKRAPFSKLAPLAQFNLGLAYEKDTKYPEAIAAYTAVVTRYPNDDIADDAQYQIGYVRLKQYKDGSYDRADSQKAREAFEDFINRYPDSEKIAQAKENLKQLEGGTNKGTMEIAKFYDKTKQYKAAVIYYNDVIKASPDTPDATLAKTRIEELRSKLGDDALKAGPERAETGEKAAVRRKLQAKVETVSRPDYVGPPAPPSPDEVAPGRPKLRKSPINPVPAVEPELPNSGSGKPAGASDTPAEAPADPAPKTNQ